MYAFAAVVAHAKLKVQRNTHRVKWFFQTILKFTQKITDVQHASTDPWKNLLACHAELAGECASFAGIWLQPNQGISSLSGACIDMPEKQE